MLWFDQLFQFLGFARYSQTPPVVMSGQPSELQCDAAGNLKVLDVLRQPPRKHIAITPSDGADIPGGPVRYIFIGTAGDLTVLGVDDVNPVTITALPAGFRYEGLVKRVRATGTSAGKLVGQP